MILINLLPLIAPKMTWIKTPAIRLYANHHPGPSYETYYTHSGTATDDVNVVIPVVRVVKRRNTANKKERRRTQSINSAFTYLRDRIPNVPADTKLSKVRCDLMWIIGRLIKESHSLPISQLDQDAATSHELHKLSDAGAGGRRYAWWLPGRVGAIVEEDKCRTAR